MKNTSATTGWRNTSLLSTEDLPSKAEGIAWCSAFGLEAVLIVVGNMLTILLFAFYKNLCKRSLFLVINMAFADLMLGTVGVPLHIYFIGMGYSLWAAKLSTSFQILLSVADTVFAQASIISASFISVERCFAVYLPLRHRTISMRTYRLVIFMLWVMAAIVTTILTTVRYFTSERLAFNVWTPYALILIIIVCGCNIAIWRKFQHGRIASQQHNRALQNQRLTKTLMFVSIIALISWLPLLVTNFLAVNCVTNLDSHLVRGLLISNLLNFSNSFLNPVVYVLRLPEFKEALGLCCFKRKAVVNLEVNERRHNRAAALTPETQLGTLPSDPSIVNMAYEQDVMNTRL